MVKVSGEVVKVSGEVVSGCNGEVVSDEWVRW